MRRQPLLFAVLVPLVTAAAARAGADIGAVLDAVCRETGAAGVAAAVVRDGEIIARGVAGRRSIDGGEPVEAMDSFLIGSCAKSMLRVLAARLVDEGRVRFDTTLAEALPDVEMLDAYRGVTLWQLLEHRGGIQPYTQMGPKLTPNIAGLEGTPMEQRAQFVARLLQEAPVARAGERFEYSNAGYGLAAHVCERAAGVPWERLVAERVWAPLGMTSARVGQPVDADLKGGPVGHFRTPEGWRAVERLRPELAPMSPAGVVSMNVVDFARFAAVLCAIEAGEVPVGFLSTEAAERVREIRVGAEMEGAPIFGGDGAYSAAFARWPSKGVAIVVLTNAGSADDVCERMIDAVRLEFAPECEKPVHPLARSPHSRLFGFKIRAEDDDRWLVGPVEAGSPAERAGLREGDLIVTMNGVAIEELGLEERVKALGAEGIRLGVERGGERVTAEMGARAGD